MSLSLKFEFEFLGDNDFIWRLRALILHHGLAHGSMKYRWTRENSDVPDGAISDYGLRLDHTLRAVAQCLARHCGR